MRRTILRRPTRRRGTALAAVLGCLLVATLLGLALLRSVLLQQRQMRTVQQQQQCFWLAEAGVQRALAALARSSDYRGETWTVPADVLGTSQQGVVVVELSATEGAQADRQLRVEARLSQGTTPGIVYRRELSLPQAAAESKAVPPSKTGS